MRLDIYWYRKERVLLSWTFVVIFVGNYFQKVKEQRLSPNRHVITNALQLWRSHIYGWRKRGKTLNLRWDANSDVVIGCCILFSFLGYMQIKTVSDEPKIFDHYFFICVELLILQKLQTDILCASRFVLRLVWFIQNIFNPTAPNSTCRLEITLQK